MEHKTLQQIRSIASIRPTLGQLARMSKRERLERWAELLERQQGRRLRTLMRVEYAPPAERGSVRADDSPLTVAFEDPVLRGEGLRSDSFGDATAFFDLSEAEAHNILCFCHYGETMSSEVAAARVRAAAVRAETARPQRLDTLFTGCFVAIVATLAFLAF
jgi:hypothetical protein